MNWPQLTIVILMIFNILAGVVLDGQPGKLYSAFDIIVGTAIAFLLLYIGGFFNYGGC